MAMSGNKARIRLSALVTVMGLIFGVSACQPKSDPTATATGSTTTLHSSVAVFTPSDGLTISQHTPLNKWAKLVPELTKALKTQGFQNSDITSNTSDSLQQQSTDIQDYVVKTIAENSGQSTASPSASASKSASSAPQNSAAASSIASRHITLVVAPVAAADQVTRQYGDYVSWPLTWKTPAGSSGTSSPSASSSPGASGSSNAGNSASAQTAAAGERLVSALKLARNNGMRVVLLSNPIQGYTPDVFVQLSTAEQIGAVQAQKLVSKLALDKASAQNPKTIEVLLPYTAGPSNTGTTSETLASQAFIGIWKVLQPYFKSGKAISPSKTLTANTTVDDWRKVAFQASQTDQIKQELAKRLNMSTSSKTHTGIAGVIAMNDFVASGVTSELSNLGYTGSSADINPQITISGIVGSITGKRDLARNAVPDPVKKPDARQQSGNGQSGSLEALNSRWPIVTGYGAYVDVIPQIVDGQQWVTALEDRHKLASDIAMVCRQFGIGGDAKKLSLVKTSTINGIATPTVQEGLLSVSASNLKKSLIDPGYITLAEAGL